MEEATREARHICECCERPWGYVFCGASRFGGLIVPRVRMR